MPNEPPERPPVFHASVPAGAPPARAAAPAQQHRPPMTAAGQTAPSDACCPTQRPLWGHACDLAGPTRLAGRCWLWRQHAQRAAPRRHDNILPFSNAVDQHTESFVTMESEREPDRRRTHRAADAPWRSAGRHHPSAAIHLSVLMARLYASLTTHKVGCCLLRPDSLGRPPVGGMLCMLGDGRSQCARFGARHAFYSSQSPRSSHPRGLAGPKQPARAEWWGLSAPSILQPPARSQRTLGGTYKSSGAI